MADMDLAEYAARRVGIVGLAVLIMVISMAAGAVVAACVLPWPER